MKFTAKEVVRGFSNKAYQMDNGTAVVKCIYIDVQLDAEHGGKGTRTDAMVVESPDVIRAIEHNAFPMLAELEVEQRATKGKVQLVCTGIKPIHAANDGGARKAA